MTAGRDPRCPETPNVRHAPADSDPVASIEAALADLEHAERALLYPSGAAAVCCVIDLLQAGSHVALSRGLDAPAYRVLEDVRRRTSGLTFSCFDPADPSALDAAITPDTRMVWVESLAGPALGPADLAMVAAVARERDLISVCDNSLATPALLQPLSYGFDIAVYGSPGYLFACRRPVPGAVAVRPGRDLVRDRLVFQRRVCGTEPAPHGFEHALSGLSHLSIRMDRVCATAGQVTAMLSRHPAVETVSWPGDPGHPGKALAARQMTGPGGALSVVLHGGLAAAERVAERSELFHRVEEPDGWRSGLDHPAGTALAGVPPRIRRALGAPDGLIRIWAGPDRPEDAVRDLEQALATVPTGR